MPNYVYRCKDCGHEFETFQRMSEDPLTECPECNGKVKRVLFVPGIVFKGAGFHVNDYPSTGSAKSECPTGSCCAAPAGAAEDKAEPATNKN